MRRYPGIHVLIILLVAAFLSGTALGAVPDNNVLDGIVRQYRTAAESWGQVLTPFAHSLFWNLVKIDMAVFGILLVLKKKDIDDIFAELANRVLYIGLFLAFLQNAGVWPKAIVDSFRMMANKANATVTGVTPDLSPSSIFDVGLRVVYLLTDSATVYEPMDGLARIICALVIFIALVGISALLLVALIEMYIALQTGVILLGFGGSRYTSDFAVKFMTFTVSIGIKIFAMQLLVGIGQNFVLQFLSSYKGTNTETFVFIGVSVVLLILVKTIPDTLQAMVNGGSYSGVGGSMLTAGASMALGGLAGAVAGGAAAVVGGGIAVSEAAKLASAQGSTGFSDTMLGAMKHLSKAGISDVAAHFAGVPGAQHGHMAGRVAARLREERLSLPPPESFSASPSGSSASSPSEENVISTHPSAGFDSSMAFDESAVTKHDARSAIDPKE